MHRKGIYSAMKKKMIIHIFKHSTVVEWQKHKKKEKKKKKKHTFPPVAPPAGEYGSNHDDATHQLYLIYNISKVRSELSWDILVDIPDKTGWLMGVCVTSRGTSKSMGDYLKCHAASRQGQSATGKLQLNRPFNWCWMFTRMLPHWSRHVYAVEFLEMSHFFHPSAVLDNCHMFNWLWPEEVMLINSIGPSIQWFK